jgi:hypothetical protein
MALLPTLDPLGPLIGEADEVYTSFEETPHDELPPGYEDGDNSKLAKDYPKDGEWKDAHAEPLPPTAAHKLRRVIVPHPRDLKRGMRGIDVFALQRALAAAKYRKWGTFTYAFGIGVFNELKKFQHAHGLTADGVYGPATHAKMAQYYDARGVYLLNQFAARNVIGQRQSAMLAAFHIAYNFRDKLHYTEGGMRWMMISNHIRHEQIPAIASGWGDCSAFATWGYWDVGAPDPNNFNYLGGYTGTLGLHGTPIDINAAKVGALVFYGPYPHYHVQISVGGANTIGFGSEIGPLYLPAAYRGDYNVCRQYAGMV